MSNSIDWLKTFFDEKDISFKTYEVDFEGETHILDSEVIQEALLNAPENEQKAAIKTLRAIDFRNGDIHHYFKFLAEALVKQNCV